MSVDKKHYYNLYKDFQISIATILTNNNICKYQNTDISNKPSLVLIECLISLLSEEHKIYRDIS
jgi:hypothetical protein